MDVTPTVDAPPPANSRRALLWCGVALLAIAGCCCGAWFSPSNPLRICEETFRYPGLVETWRAQGQGMADHFPDEVPEGATGVRLRASSGFLQANAFLRLRYTTSPSDAERTIARFRDRATFRFRAARWEKADGTRVDGPRLDIVLWDAPERPETLELVVLGHGSEGVDIDDHFGVAVDHATGVVWFWAEHP